MPMEIKHKFQFSENVLGALETAAGVPEEANAFSACEALS